MAVLIPIYQKFFSVYFGKILSVTKIKTLSTSDTFTLPLALVIGGRTSIGQVRGQNENQISNVSQSSSTGVVTLATLASAVGQTVTVVALHPDANAASVG